MKVYVNDSLVVLYGEWPVEPEPLDGEQTETFFPRMHEYEQALKKAIAEAVPFEDQDKVLKLIRDRYFKALYLADPLEPGFYDIQAEVEVKNFCASDCCTEDLGCEHCREPKKLAIITPLSSGEKETTEQIEADANALLIVKLLDVMDRSYHHMKYNPPDKTKMSYNEWHDILEHLQYYRSEYGVGKPSSVDTNIEENTEFLLHLIDVVSCFVSECGNYYSTKTRKELIQQARETFKPATTRPVQEKPDLFLGLKQLLLDSWNSNEITTEFLRKCQDLMHQHPKTIWKNYVEKQV